MAALQKVKIRGLFRLAATVLAFVGSLVCVKAVYDLFWGEPEANLYAPEPWGFVSRQEWLRYGGFELAYGLACLGLAWYVLRTGRRFPEVVERPKKDEGPELI
ncbi:MAG: hypothetical protein HY402_01520 [Elusimicrobia bacterium]|nr:hypothetical protein [Elusimicrobiota bacterium]